MKYCLYLIKIQTPDKNQLHRSFPQSDRSRLQRCDALSIAVVVFKTNRVLPKPALTPQSLS